MTDTTREAVNLTGLDDYLRDPSVGLPWDIRIRIADALTAQRAEIARLTADRDAWAAESADNLRKLVEATARIDAMRDDIITLGAQVNSLMRERDAALAQVAGAFEAAAQTIDTAGDGVVAEALGQRLCCSGYHCGCMGADVSTYLQHIIRALTPADATAALDRIKRQARAEGMRRAATICNRSYGDGLGAAHKAILAAAKQEEQQ